MFSVAPAADVAKLSQTLTDGRFLWGLSQAAKSHNVSVNVGIHERPPTNSDGRVFNTNVVITSEGEIGLPYRKRHLFDVDLAPTGPTIKESNTTIPGSSRQAIIASTPVGRLGVSCAAGYLLSMPFK